MWPDLRADVELDLAALRREMDETSAERAAMLARDTDHPPNGWDLRAAAGLMQQCYSGMENAIKRIVTVVDGPVMKGEGWHASLLKQAAAPGHTRGPIVSDELLKDLREFMGFRHVARMHYGFDFDWDRMSPLLQRLPDVVDRFAAEVREFLDLHGAA